MKTHKQFKEELLRDPELKRIDEELDLEFKIYSAIVDARIKKKMTQKQLARKVGVAQSALARFESGKVSATLQTAHRILSGLGFKLKVVKA